MNLVDLVRGAGSIALIMVVAGGIAYVGDRVGHQVGRRRLTMFGIRPRYTSTIVAIGTGMLIAFSVTMVALVSSREVRTAFFRLSQINAQISELQAQQQALESKVNNGELIVPVNALMVPFYKTIKQGEPVDQRIADVKTFFRQAVSYMNGTYFPLGLRKYIPPASVDKKLVEEFGSPEVTDRSLANTQLLFVTSPQNQYKNDEITFYLNLYPDVLVLGKGRQIVSLRIPGNARATPSLVISELQQAVAGLARTQLHLPLFLAENVQVVQVYPSLSEMQRQLASGNGDYIITAYAAEDIYTHVGGLPIVVTLTQVK